MIVEGAQMLSTAHRTLDGTQTTVQRYVNGSLPARYRNVKVWQLPDGREQQLYRATHANHPCSIWCRENDDNYAWLWKLTAALCSEYYHRYGQHKKIPTKHKVEESGLLDLLMHPPKNIPIGNLTPFVQAMPDQYKDANPVQAYRNYYLGEKQSILKYTHRTIPTWI